MLVLFMEREADAAAVEVLGAYDGPERVAVCGRDVFIDYAAGWGALG